MSASVEYTNFLLFLIVIFQLNNQKNRCIYYSGNERWCLRALNELQRLSVPKSCIVNICSLYEAFILLLHVVVDESEQWISENESKIGVSYVPVASLEDLNIKIEQNKVSGLSFEKFMSMIL